MKNISRAKSGKLLSILVLVVVFGAMTFLSLYTQNETHAQTGPPAALVAPMLDAEGGDDHVTLTWGEVANADSYNLIVWDGATSEWLRIGGALTGTSYVHGGRSAGTTYFYYVRAEDDNGAWSAWSNYASATVSAPSAPSALPAPSLAAVAGAGQVTLTWEAVDDADGYKLIVWDWATSKWVGIGGELSGTSYTHRGLTVGTTYIYYIRAEAASGARSAWSESASATVTEAQGPTPTVTALSGLTLAAEPGAGQITLRWGMVANADSYRLIFWERALTDWREIGGVLTGTSYIHSGLTAGTTYFYRISSVDASGAMSEWSEIASATVTEAGSETQTSTATPTITASPSMTPTPTITPTPASSERGALVALYKATDGRQLEAQHQLVERQADFYLVRRHGGRRQTGD